MNRITPVFLALLAFHADVQTAAAEVAVGVARLEITPTEPVVLAGYGGRSGPFEGIDSRLWVRALVIGDVRPVAIVVVDNCGVPAAIADRLKRRLQKHGLSQDRVVVAATHTHNAPALPGYAPVLWRGRTAKEQDQATARYTEWLIERMESAVEAAAKNRQPMTLGWYQGRVGFGGNRRILNAGKWAGFGFQRDKPVDHSLPILFAKDKKGIVRAIWANYACHCTTVGSRNFIGGDWAGYANDAIEQDSPQAVSLITIGCGADIGPQPSGSIDLAKQHGRSLANAVRAALKEEAVILDTAPEVATQEIALPFDSPKDVKHWRQLAKGAGFESQLAGLLLEHHEDTGKIPQAVQYKITVWDFDDRLAMVFMPGEVVVDYAVRLKQELDWRRLWITGWANDMPGYIPSRRVLLEGGYEAQFSQVYYGHPGAYHPSIENRIVDCITGMVGEDYEPSESQPPCPHHALPNHEEQAFNDLSVWLQADHSDDEQAIIDCIAGLLPRVQSGCTGFLKSDAQPTDWHNFAGDFVARWFIRQQQQGTTIRWRADGVGRSSKETVLCFSGGLGWASQPAGSGFSLIIGPNTRVAFQVTRKPARWISADKKAELIYLPTWTSNEDSGGFFFLTCTLPDDRILQVESAGNGSQRWFAIDREQKFESYLTRLKAAFAAGAANR